MSFLKKGRNFRTVSGKTFPRSADRIDRVDGNQFRSVMTETLHQAFGGTRVSIKAVMAYTDASERTVKNWFQGKNGPNGENLIELMRYSDEVLEAVLLMAGREEVLAGKMLLDAEDKLAEIRNIIEQLQSAQNPPGDDRTS